MKRMFVHIKYLLLVVKYSFMQIMTYKVDFILGFIASSIWNLGAILFLKFTLDKVTSIAGWDFYDLVFLHGIGQVWAYLYYFASYPSFHHWGNFVNNGDLDFLLLKPLNSQLTATFQRVDINSLFSLIQPTAMITYVLINKQYNLAVMDIILSFFSIILTVVIVHLLETTLSTSVFWFPRSELGSLFYATADISYYPYEIFQNKILKVIFFTILPYALIINVPFRLLVGKMNYEFLVLQLVVLIFFLLLSKIVWKAGLKRYQGASS